MGLATSGSGWPEAADPADGTKAMEAPGNLTTTSPARTEAMVTVSPRADAWI